MIKSIARWSVLASLFTIPFLSLYISSGGYFPFITGKNFGFRILVEIAFAGWLVLAALDKQYRPRFSWTLVLYGLLVVWMFVADVFAVNPHKAFWSNYERMDGWVTLAHVFLFFLVAGAVLTAEKLWRKWWLAFIAATALVSVYGLLQMIGAAGIHQSTTRADASLGNSEYLAGYFLFAIMVTLWQAFETRARELAWLKYCLFGLAVVQVIVLFGTGTRGTVVALAGASGFAALMWMLTSGKRGRQGAAVMLTLLIVLVGGLFFARDASFVTESPSLQRYASIFNLRYELNTRITIWGMALEGSKEDLLTGYGHEGFNYVFNTYYEPSLYAQEPWFDRAHNMFIDWLINGGIPALLLFISVLLSAMYALYRAPVSNPERILLLSALVGYGIQGLVVFDNLFTYIPFAAILALAHTVSSRPIKRFENAPAISLEKAQILVAPGAVVLAVLLIGFVNVPGVRGSGDLIRALMPTNSPEKRLTYFKEAVDSGSFATQEITEQLSNFTTQAAGAPTVPDPVKQEIIAYALERFAAELTRAPRDARLRVQYAILLRNIGQLDEARTQSAQARQLSPNKQTIITEQGIEALQAEDYIAAETFFTEAYELDTNNKEIVVYIAASKILQREVPEAQALLETAYATSTVNHPILTLAYYQIKDWPNLIRTLRLRSIEEDTPENAFQLAIAYAESGDRAAALTQVRATIAKFPQASAQGEAILQQLRIAP